MFCAHFSRFFCRAIALIAVAAPLAAQQIAGNWQGTVDTGQKLRVIVQLEQATDGALTGRVYSIDQSPQAAPISKAVFHDRVLSFTVEEFHASYEGTLSADGGSFAGTMTQGSQKPLTLVRATPETAWKTDPSPHTVQMVTVDKDVKLEVLDWGGSGRPLVLLTGLGNDAHVFDQFAPKLAERYHVYGITRRGFGVSSKPEPVPANYSASRMGEDVLAVMDALHLDRPVVAGHSVAGEELSYLGNEHPEKVAGLIYLDAGFPYAMYDQVNGNLMIDALELRQRLNDFLPGSTAGKDQKVALDELIVSLKMVEREAVQQRASMEDLPPPPPGAKMPPIGVAILTGQQRFTSIRVPALAIYALPHDLGGMYKDNPKARAAAADNDLRSTGNQAAAFERQVPGAHVVRIPNANHYLFKSNEKQVLDEMNAFIATLPAAN